MLISLKSGFAHSLSFKRGNYMILKDGKNKTEKLIDELAGGFLEENGLELYYAEYKKEGPEWFLYVFIDKAEAASDEDEGSRRYISTDDCEKVSRYLSDRLDEADVIKQKYTLIVSSPGLDRQLRDRKDFERYIGSEVDIKLYKKIDGSKDLSGELTGFTDEAMTVAAGGEVKEIPFDDIVKVCLAVLF